MSFSYIFDQLNKYCFCLYRITPYLADRFSSKMRSQPVEMISIKGNNFILINSMAMERDGCFLCSNAENTLMNITCMQNTNFMETFLWLK